VTNNPNDLACPGLTADHCYIWGEEEYEYSIQNADRPRATATSLFADEVGVSFTRVSCKVAYIRFLTRQESYEMNAMEMAESHWYDMHQPPLHLNAAFEWETPDGVVVTAPAELSTVPSDWKPDEDDPVWQFCEKTTPGAVKCWTLGVRG
jgi:hypothetical protein